NGTLRGVVGAFWPVCGGAASCLAGNWRSDSVTVPNFIARGGSGIMLIVKTGGHATIDYNGMQPIQQVNSLTGRVSITETYSGTAAADISAHDGLLTVGNIQSSALTGKTTNSFGQTFGIHAAGLGWVFYGDGKVPGQTLNFTCNGTTLVIEDVLAP